MSQIPLRDDPTRPAFGGPRLLERALVAISFTPITRIATDPELVSMLQERLRHSYPFFRRQADPTMRVDLSPAGEVSMSRDEAISWHFADAEKGRSISLTQDLIAFDVREQSYDTWPSFIDAAREIFKHFADVMAPSHVVRQGVRYLNTGKVGGKKDPRSFCARELTSVSGSEDLELSDLMWHFNVEEGRMLLRNGLMPENASYDPSFFQPREEKTWYLDIDVFGSDFVPFDIDRIMDSLFQQAKRLHAVYYWAMTREDEKS